jgi:hypothetical protein
VGSKLLEETDTVFVTRACGAAVGLSDREPILAAYFGTPPNHSLIELAA